MKVQCLTITFRPGKFGPSVKKTVGNQNHKWDQPLSEDDKKPRLVVQVRTERGSVADIAIDSFFKMNLGRLTEWRRTLVAQAMPIELQVIVCRTDDGMKHLEIVEAELESWLSNCYDSRVVTKAERRMKKGSSKGISKGKLAPLKKKLTLRDHKPPREKHIQIPAD